MTNTLTLWFFIAGLSIILGLMLTHFKNIDEQTNYTDIDTFHNALSEQGEFSREEAEGLYAVWQKREELEWACNDESTTG